jgi:outer membrane protein assembly factor BamB
MRPFQSGKTQPSPRPLARWLVLALLAGGLLSTAARADDWPQWLGPQRDGVWRETGILTKFPKAGPKILWRKKIDMGYAGPAVVGDKVYVTDRILAKDAKNPANPFAKAAVKGMERVLCLSAADGEEVWKYEYPCTYQISYPAGPRTTPVVAGGKVYTLGAMGDLLCLDAAKGKRLWSKNFPKDYDAPVPLWGFSSSPLLDKDKLFCLVGGEGSTVVAFDKDSGKELWKALSAGEIGYCPPIVIEAGGKRQLIVWHPRAVVSLNPENGKVYWTEKSNAGANMTIPTPQKSGDRLFFSCFYSGSMMLKLDKDKPAAAVVWQGKHFLRPGRGSEQPDNTDGLHCVMSTPLVVGNYIYGVCSYGQLRCIKADTGERVWDTLKATGGELERWANAFLVKQADQFFLFNEHGDLIIAKLTPKGYEEISRAHILDATNGMASGLFGGNKKRLVLWSCPAFANKCMFARNDKEIVCVSLAAGQEK